MGNEARIDREKALDNMISLLHNGKLISHSKVNLDEKILG